MPRRISALFSLSLLVLCGVTLTAAEKRTADRPTASREEPAAANQTTSKSEAGDFITRLFVQDGATAEVR